jgi:predicted SnoaL-like aldol condensation-catalyzing enzyme
MSEEPTTPDERSLDRDTAAAFVDDYGRTWESWDVENFAALYGDGVVYVAHPQETIVGRKALSAYFVKQKAEQGEVSVRMGKPMLDGDRVAAEFWVTASKGDEKESFAGCFIARLDGASGLCTYFREYWFDLQGHVEAYAGWGD